MKGRAVLGTVLALGCASDLVATEGRWRHREHGYSVATPDPRHGWRRTRLEGAVLAFERPPADRMSLQSRCGGSVAEPQVMARHLLIGVKDRALLQAGPLAVAGIGGWSQTFEVKRDGEVVRMKTVTVVVGDCIVDWVLASRGDFAAAETDFDAWWESFLPSGERGDAVGL